MEVEVISDTSSPSEPYEQPEMISLVEGLSYRLVDNERLSTVALEGLGSTRYLNLHLLQAHVLAELVELGQCTPPCLPEDLVLGFISPGHGLRGKRIQLKRDTDLDGMYDMSTKAKLGKIAVFLWHRLPKTASSVKRMSESHGDADVLASEFETSASSKSTNDKTSSGVGRRSKTSSSLMNAFQETTTIREDLEKRHGDRFTSLQYTSWAHMLHTKMHSSRDEPPRKRMFQHRACDKESRAIASNPAPKHDAVADVAARAAARDVLLKQLSTLAELTEKGILTEQACEEQSSVILRDMAELNKQR